jgi:hypothetical protein
VYTTPLHRCNGDNCAIKLSHLGKSTSPSPAVASTQLARNTLIGGAFSPRFKSVRVVCRWVQRSVGALSSLFSPHNFPRLSSIQRLELSCELPLYPSIVGPSSARRRDLGEIAGSDGWNSQYTTPLQRLPEETAKWQAG